MELVYLWVEDYKNIKKQGFNFSPNFECEFFPGYEKYTDKNGEEKKRLKNNCELKITPKENLLKDFFGENIKVTAIVGENGSGKSSLIEEMLNIQIIGSIIIYKKNGIVYIETKRSINVITSLEYKIIDKYSRVNFIYLNSDILKTANIFNTSSWMQSGTYSSNVYIKKLKDNAESENIDENLKRFTEKYKHYYYDLEYFQKEIYKLLLVTFSQNIPFSFDYIPHTILLSVKQENITALNDENLKLKNYCNGIEIQGEIEILSFFEKYFKNQEELFFDAVKKNLIGILIFDNKGRNLFHLSSGERKLFVEMLIIYEAIKNNDTDDNLLLLDEPDLALHPNWQKKYMKKLINLLSIFHTKRFHIIVTSHSPFILSDLPKENVIFLEKGKQVYPFEEGKQTFGANIHTLLSHGFFMKEGFMGEFAKEKIDKSIKYLNQKAISKEELDYCENIVSIIGEPIIKRELQRMLKNKMELSNKTEIDKIREKVDTLTKELEESSKRLEELENKDKK